jgi:hypothetical protein
LGYLLSFFVVIKMIVWFGQDIGDEVGTTAEEIAEQLRNGEWSFPAGPDYIRITDKRAKQKPLSGVEDEIVLLDEEYFE